MEPSNFFNARGSELLAISSEIAVAVLISPDRRDIELIPIKPNVPDSEMSGLCAGRALEFVGVLGLVKGIAHAQLEVPLAEPVSMALASAFAAYVHNMHAPSKAAGDEILWLEALYGLPDNRPEA